jgi:hypothetical protein
MAALPLSMDREGDLLYPCPFSEQARHAGRNGLCPEPYVNDVISAGNTKYANDKPFRKVIKAKSSIFSKITAYSEGDSS